MKHKTNNDKVSILTPREDTDPRQLDDYKVIRSRLQDGRRPSQVPNPVRNCPNTSLFSVHRLLAFVRSIKHTSAWNELTVAIEPWYKSQHGAPWAQQWKGWYKGRLHSPGWWSQCRTRQEATTEKANKLNNKQNPQSAKQALWSEPAQLKKLSQHIRLKRCVQTNTTVHAFFSVHRLLAFARSINTLLHVVD